MDILISQLEEVLNIFKAHTYRVERHNNVDKTLKYYECWIPISRRFYKDEYGERCHTQDYYITYRINSWIRFKDQDNNLPDYSLDNPVMKVLDTKLSMMMGELKLENLAYKWSKSNVSYLNKLALVRYLNRNERICRKVYEVLKPILNY